MKKIIILGLAVAGIAFTSLTASAATDEKYPASSFESKVIYIDQDAVAQAPEKDEKYPAANFESKVVYIDQSYVDQSQDESDPKYPAAYFKPRVIYP